METAIEPDPASPKRPERQPVGDFRKLVLATLQGADPLPVQHLLIQVYCGIERDIGQDRLRADRLTPEDRAGHDRLCRWVEGYYRMLDALEAMDDAIEAEDLLGLYHGFKAFESAAWAVDLLD